MALYQHQQKIISDDPLKCGLFLGTGGGKTIIALSLARGKTLVICPKTQKLDGNWEREAKKNNLKLDLTVMSKEFFRKDHHLLPKFNTVIIDEAHTCLGVTPNIRWRNKKAIPKASQIFESIQSYLAKYNPERLYLVTATPIRSPMTVWAAAELLGKNIDFYSFRNFFYFQLPMPGREVWQAKNTDKEKDKLAGLVKKLGYTGRLDEFFDVPEQTFKTVYVNLTEKQKRRIREIPLEYPDAIVKVGKIHQIENGVLSGDDFNDAEFFDNEKLDTLLDFALEFPKMIIFAKYKAQIRQIRMKFHDYNAFEMTGDTDNRGELLSKINKMDKYILICQAQISAGWEVPNCSVMVFASRTYSYVDYAQSLGRIQRANNIKKNLYINLVTKGGVDEAVDKCLSMKQDFDDRIYSL